ncbi:MAG: hypothetical protein ACQEQV_02125 [Fibrobacterota bacterium]
MKNIGSLLLLSITLLVSAEWEIDYDLTYEAVLDGNIGQNITEEFSWYSSPKVGVSLDADFGRGELALSNRSTFENYLQKRSSVLNSPLIYPSLSYEYDFGTYETDIDLSLAGYYSHDYIVTKLSYRLDWDHRFELSERLDMDIYLRGMYNDYGDDDRDGLRYNTDLSFDRDIEHTLLGSLIFDDVRISVKSEFNSAKNDTASYAQIEGAADLDFEIRRVDIDLGASLRKKVYGAEKINPHSGVTVTPVNRYLYTSMGIGIPLFGNFDLDLDGKLRFKESTYPTFDYDRHTLGVALSWDGSRELFR